MSEDVSATIRVGITVILVAALVATVLNLMVMANSLLQNGQTTLQSGIDAVSEQEFAPFNNTKVSGTQVNTALSLFQGRDIAICIRTDATVEAMKTVSLPTGDGAITPSNVYINYGAMLTVDGKASNAAANLPAIWEFKDSAAPTLKNTSAKTFGIQLTEGTQTNWLTQTAKSVCFTTVHMGSTTDGAYALIQKDGDPWYTGNLHNTNGLVDCNYDTVGTTILGNAAFLLSSSRFTSVLIKDPTGSVIGIVFTQIS